MSDWKNVQYKDGKMRTSEGGGGGGSSTFTGLDDVSFDNLQNGQVPKYNATTQKWENADESGGTVTDVEVNGASVVNAQKVAEIKSYKEVTQAEYNALPSSKTSDGILYCIKDADGLEVHHYSTTEQVVAIWISGKPVYEKVLQISTTSGYYYLNVESLNINEIIGYHIFIHNNTGGDYAFCPYYESSNDKMGLFMPSDKKNICIRAGSSYAYGSGFLILRYTKTTD